MNNGLTPEACAELRRQITELWRGKLQVASASRTGQYEHSAQAYAYGRALDLLDAAEAASAPQETTS